MYIFRGSIKGKLAILHNLISLCYFVVTFIVAEILMILKTSHNLHLCFTATRCYRGRFFANSV